MINIQLDLNSIDKVKDFCTLASQQDFDVTVVSVDYIVNGKSILGLFSIDLSKPVLVKFSDDSNSAIEFSHTLKNKTWSGTRVDC